MKLTAQQLSFYYENGYLLIPSLFSKDESTSISQIIEDLVCKIRDEIKLNSQEQQTEDFHGSIVPVSSSPTSHELVIKRIIWAASAAPNLLSIGRDEKLLEIISQILEENVADHLINQIHLKYPGDGVAFPWHQDEQNRRKFDPDWNDCGKNGSYVVAITAVDPCFEENGPLYIIPGSHKFGYLNFGDFLSNEQLEFFLANKHKESPSKPLPDVNKI